MIQKRPTTVGPLARQVIKLTGLNWLLIVTVDYLSSHLQT